MNKEVKEDLLALVKDLIVWIENDCSVESSRSFEDYSGLCKNIVLNSISAGLVDQVFVVLYQKWPKYSGNSAFPVMSEKDPGDAVDQFIQLPHYEGHQKELRLDLLRFVECQLESEINQTGFFGILRSNIWKN